jgi:small GTP-binding protein
MPGFKRVKIKICLLGDPAVGKTSLIQKYIYNFFGDTYMRTLGTKVSRKVIQFKDTKNNMEYELILMIWDIMGQKFSSMPLDKYLQLAQGALIVCDITRKETFTSLTEWKKTLYKETDEVPVICLANKIDLEKNAAIKVSEFENFCQGENVDYFLTSAKTGQNVNEAFLKLGKLIIKAQGEPESVSKVTKKADTEPGITLPAGFDIEEKSTVEVINETMNEPVSVSQSQISKDVKNMTEKTEIKPGMSYLIKEEKPHRSFRIFRELINKKIRGLCITRTHPARIREEYQIKDIPILWLSADSTKTENVVVPTFLPQLNTLIIDFIQKHNDVVIILEGIEYLIDQNDFKAVLRLVHSLNDYIMGSNARLLIPLDPLILQERELHILTRDFKIL